MSGMFMRAGKFNGDVYKWEMSKVIDMKYMFAIAADFNGDLSYGMSQG